jgi:hypothetical protein
MICFGPNDLSAATDRFDIYTIEVTEAMTLVLRKCREASVMAFVFANDLEYAEPSPSPAGHCVTAVTT